MISKVGKLFLSEEECQEAQGVLKPHPPPGDSQFSIWLEQALEKKLSALPCWSEAQPIALGSWARHELCPRSDIDLLLTGPESNVRHLVDALNLSGLKIRHRWPKNLEDWSEGVDPFDVMALLNAKSFSAESEVRLQAQQKLIHTRLNKLRGHWFRLMRRESLDRGRRHDSVTNYLEPNIKYGKGGLRDLHQALFLFEVFPEKLNQHHEKQKTIRELVGFLLLLRQKMHLIGLGDVLVAGEQKTLAQWQGFEDSKEFMRKVQQVLAEGSFYADWTFERVASSNLRNRQFDSLSWSQIGEAAEHVIKDPCLQIQEKARQLLKTQKPLRKDLPWPELLKRFFSWRSGEDGLMALFGSGLMSAFLPELARVSGLVQHDQYHRYTVDTHLRQCVREVLRTRLRPRRLGKLSAIVKSFSPSDWNILLWSALYHDLAKGKKGDHSELGAQLVKKNFVQMKMRLRETVEVAWIVKSHLLLSAAAFRRNPRDPSTWRFLHERGVKGARLRRLAVFTALDIVATNPEAWNSWKEELLFQLVNALESPQATKYMGLLENAERKKLNVSREFIERLDPGLATDLPASILLSDYKEIKRAKKDLEPLVWKSRSGDTWVRFHSLVDRPGLFLGFTQKLYSLGCQVRTCAVHTFPKYGVYDWFSVKTNRSAAQIKKMLTVVSDRKIDIPKVNFDQIQLVSQEGAQAVLSFRGQDQRGALLAAAEALYKLGFTINWARVHTWGRQIDDVFEVTNSDAEYSRKLNELVHIFSANKI